MLDGVYNQRLEQQRWQPGLGGLRVKLPADLQAIAKADLFNGQITRGQRNLLPQRD